MESIFPLFVLCFIPIIALGLAFAAGRWSARYKIHVEPQQPPYNNGPQRHKPAATQPGYYDNFEEV